MLRRRRQEEEYDPLIEQAPSAAGIAGRNADLAALMTHLFDHGNRIAHLFNVNAQVIWTTLLERTRENQDLAKKLDQLYREGFECGQFASIPTGDVFSEMLRRTAGRR